MHTLPRQTTAHPLFVPLEACDYLELDDSDRLQKATKRHAAPGETAICMNYASRIQPDMSASPDIIDKFDRVLRT
ncbi:hypothetical protein D6D17_09742 [Aureobasidium pullulans]|nr:hypothetical protein D6D17_09742 [Aureobasidium pullulans]